MAVSFSDDAPTPDRGYAQARRRLMARVGRTAMGEPRVYRWAAATGFLEWVEGCFADASRTLSRKGLEETVDTAARKGLFRKVSALAVAGVILAVGAAFGFRGFLAGSTLAVLAGGLWYRLIPAYLSGLLMGMLDLRDAITPCSTREIDTVQRWREACATDTALHEALAAWCATGPRRLWEFQALEDAWVAFNPYHQRRATQLRKHQERHAAGREAATRHGMIAAHEAADLDAALPAPVPASSSRRL